MTFSNFDASSSPLFKSLELLKLSDLVYLSTVIFMFKFHNCLLPPVFDKFFVCVNQTHSYNTRLSAKISYSLPKIKTNYGQFNIRYVGPKTWNTLSDDLKKYLFQNSRKLLLRKL